MTSPRAPTAITATYRKPRGENARYLEAVMTAAGFVGYSGEWWHYSDSTAYPVVQ